MYQIYLRNSNQVLDCTPCGETRLHFQYTTRDLEIARVMRDKWNKNADKYFIMEIDCKGNPIREVKDEAAHPVKYQVWVKGKTTNYLSVCDGGREYDSLDDAIKTCSVSSNSAYEYYVTLSGSTERIADANGPIAKEKDKEPKVEQVQEDRNYKLWVRSIDLTTGKMSGGPEMCCSPYSRDTYVLTREEAEIQKASLEKQHGQGHKYFILPVGEDPLTYTLPDQPKEPAKEEPAKEEPAKEELASCYTVFPLPFTTKDVPAYYVRMEGSCIGYFINGVYTPLEAPDAQFVPIALMKFLLAQWDKDHKE